MSHVFRAVDVVALVAISIGVIVDVSPTSLLHTPVSQVVPYAAGAYVAAAVLRTSGAYRFARSRSLIGQLAHVLAVTAGVGLVVGLTNPLFEGGSRSQRGAWLWAGLVCAVMLVLHTSYWVIVRRWRANGWLNPNIVLVGATPRAEALISDAIEHGDINVIGVFDDRLNRSPLAVLGVPVLGDTHALIGHRISPHVDLIVVTVDPLATARVGELMSRLSGLPNEITLMIGQDDPNARIAAVAHLADAPLAPVGRIPTAEHRAFAKRVQDLALGLPLLILASPLLAVVALAVKLDSKGPVFFRQRRHGFNNEEIMVCKFRSMRQETTDATASRQVTADDDRVTRVGRLLRKTSLDEVPQLINVVRGEMSLVGPRPHAIGMKTGEVESASLVAQYAHRHRIKPGMTGWAAVNGSRGPLHHAAEVERRVALDVDYIERQSFWFDLEIMLLTIPALLGDRSAVR